MFSSMVGIMVSHLSEPETYTMRWRKSHVWHLKSESSFPLCLSCAVFTMRKESPMKPALPLPYSPQIPFAVTFP